MTEARRDGTARRAWALVLGALYVLGVVYGTFVLVLRPPPPAAVPLPAARAALTRHVLFVVVDGLRYDVATDPERMPRFALAMQAHRSAEILAGRISMTSAAVQNYGTGQRGRFAQIVRNINPDPPPYNSWLQNAAQRGLTLALAGDPVWVEMYGKSFGDKLLDPEGVAMDHDFNQLTFRDVRALLAKAPSVLVAHFVTPDHQGHVYGIPSARYRKHIHDFDEQLYKLLTEVPGDFSVIVTSDHGAADSGTHGADVPVQRRSPIFAYGPGIAAGGGEAETLDQSDLANTFAALLGVPAAAHSQGHILSGWLDVTPAQQAEFGCADAERAVALVRAEDADAARELGARLKVGCDLEQAPEARRQAADAVARQADAAVSGARDFFSWRASLFLGGTLLGAALVAWLLVGRRLGAALVCAGLGLLAIALVAGLEHLPGSWPKGVDAALFVLFDLPALLFLIKPERLIALLDAHPLWAAAIVPGGFAVAYPTDLEPVAYAICWVAPLVIVCSKSADSWGLSWRHGERWQRLTNLAFIAAFGAALTPAGLSASGAYSELAQHEALTLGLAMALVTSLAWLVVRRLPEPWLKFVWFAALAVASLLLRRVVPAWVGRPLLVGLPLAGALLLWRGRFAHGLWLLFVGYLWVSRDFEVLPVAGGLGIAALLGERFGDAVAAWSRGRFLIALGVLFCLLFLVRLGMSAGLDALSMDFAAGAFRDPHVPAWWITFAVIWKYVLVAVALMLTLLRGLPRELAERGVLSLIALGLCRAAILLGMMQCSLGSFWTSMRVMSDLPFALLFAVSAALVLPWCARTTRRPACWT